MTSIRAVGRSALGGLVAVLLTAGCGSGPPQSWTEGRPRPAPTVAPTRRPSPAPSPSPGQAYPAYAATARVADVGIYDRPGGGVRMTLANPQPSGAPLTFLVRSRAEGWTEVLLPVRPNGSTGWVRDSAIDVRGVPYRIDVARGAHRLRLYSYDTLVEEFPIAVGTENTPTPGGVFYIKELLIPTNPDGFYGPYAYGLSGFSNVLTSYNGGQGVIGIHGTSEPDSIGRDTSNGCIRMANADITRLAALLPLGTPVRILA